MSARGHEGVRQPHCHICIYILSSSQLKYPRVPMRRRLAIHPLVIVVFAHNSAVGMTLRLSPFGVFATQWKWLPIKHQAWTCQPVFWQASPSVSRNRTCSCSSSKMFSRRSHDSSDGRSPQHIELLTFAAYPHFLLNSIKYDNTADPRVLNWWKIVHADNCLFQ